MFVEMKTIPQCLDLRDRSVGGCRIGICMSTAAASIARLACRMRLLNGRSRPRSLPVPTPRPVIGSEAQSWASKFYRSRCAGPRPTAVTSMLHWTAKH